ncbi:MAG: hypothetical protein ACRCUP_07315 [Mycoplasmatales bacterium]
MFNNRKKSKNQTEILLAIDNLIASTSFIQVVSWEEFLKSTLPLLTRFNCDFKYLRKNCKKNGHLRRKYTDYTRSDYQDEIRIESADDDVSKIYTMSHEITHLINNHLESKTLTAKQKEVVADTVAKMIVKRICTDDLSRASISRKMPIDDYAKNYIQNMALSEQRSKLIIHQILVSFQTIINYL